ncbi:MAG: hypothetical protein IKV03_00455 [Alphaproteobacteria bacterium]|nr:hypothetical protein [Alphaproteobacteria bacterium]
MKRYTIGLGLFLSACTAQPLETFNVDTYANQNPIYLNVSLLDTKSDVLTYNRLPHIEKDLPITPNDVLLDWAHNRFRATNKYSLISAEFTVLKAYMTQTDTPTPKWYILDNTTYRLDYDVMLQFKQNEKILYTQTATGWEEYAIPQKSPLTSKEKVWEKMMNNMVQKINNKIVPEIPNKFK